MLRRLPTDVAIGVLATVGLLVGAMWGMALVGGDVGLLFRENSGNHGVWRHHMILRELDGYASLYAFLIGLPGAWLGIYVEESRRAKVVGLVALGAVVINCLHFPLFD